MCICVVSEMDVKVETGSVNNGLRKEWKKYVSKNDNKM